MKLIDLLKTLHESIFYTVYLECIGLEVFGSFILSDIELNEYLDCLVSKIELDNGAMEITIKVSL